MAKSKKERRAERRLAQQQNKNGCKKKCKYCQAKCKQTGRHKPHVCDKEVCLRRAGKIPRVETTYFID